MPRRTRHTMLAAVLVGALALNGCTAARDEQGAGGPTTALAPEASPGGGVPLDPALAGLNGATPTWNASERFRAAIAAIDPEATDMVAAAAAYDAVVIAALSAETARSDAPGLIAANLASSTRVGEPCGDFETCRAIALKEGDFDYDGISGPLALNNVGVPTQADFFGVSISPNGAVVTNDPIGAQLRADNSLPPATDPRRGPAPDGTLKIATVLALSGPALTAARSASAGVSLAVEHINDPTIGGVLARPIELLVDGSQAATPQELANVANTLIDQGADVVIGAVDEPSAIALVEVANGRGVPLISPIDTTATELVNDAGGLYFRTTPTDELAGRMLGQLASYNGVTDTLVVTVAAPRHEAFAAQVTAALDELEATVSSQVPIPPGEEIAPFAELIAAAEPTSIIVVGDTTVATQLATELGSKGLGPSQILWFGAPWVFGGR